MTTTHKGGVLVAVANPEGVAPLIAIALAASLGPALFATRVRIAEILRYA